MRVMMMAVVTIKPHPIQHTASAELWSIERRIDSFDAIYQKS
jgi:hypothetical protein